MANITTLDIGGTTHPTVMKMKTPYYVERIIDFADALVAKGSALAASDTIEALVVPAGTAILAAGLRTVAVDDATTLTLDLGKTGGDVDEWVDGYDQAAAAAGAFSADLDSVPSIYAPLTTADTIDLLFATLTGTLTVGKVAVWALFLDCSGNPTPLGATIAQPKS